MGVNTAGELMYAIHPVEKTDTFSKCMCAGGFQILCKRQSHGRIHFRGFKVWQAWTAAGNKQKVGLPEAKYSTDKLQQWCSFARRSLTCGFFRYKSVNWKGSQTALKPSSLSCCTMVAKSPPSQLAVRSASSPSTMVLPLLKPNLHAM